MVQRFPRAETVISRTQGVDPRATMALQHAAIMGLNDALSFVAEKEGPTAEYEDLRKEYLAALSRITEPITEERNRGRDQKDWDRTQDSWLKIKYAAERRVSKDSLYAAYDLPLTVAGMQADHQKRIAAASKGEYEDVVGIALWVILPFAVVQLICILLFRGIRKGYRYAQGNVALDKDDPTIFLVDGVRYTLGCYTGQVVDARSTITTHTSVRGNQNYVESSSHSVEHDKFHVIDENGKEHAVHLWDSGVQVRSGSNVSAAWFVGPDAKPSSYILFMNHDTDRYVALWSNLSKYFHSRSTQMATNGFWLGVFSGALAPYVLFIALTELPSLLWIFLFLVVQSLVGLACWIWALSAYSGKRSIERGLFSSRDIPRIVHYLRNRTI